MDLYYPVERPDGGKDKGESSMTFLDIAKKRHSVRNYKNVEVEEEKIQQVLEAARMAPSACNYQPVRFIVITDPKIKNTISKEAFSGNWLQAAPMLIAVCGDHSKSWKRRDGKDHCDIDVAISIDHLTLAAADIGLGTCWICSFNSQLCHDILALPENYEVIALIPMGYPDDKIPDKNRKNMDEIITRI